MTDMPPYLAGKDEGTKYEQEQSESDCSDLDDWDLPQSFDKPRHLELIRGAERVEHSWRVKEKYKTHCVALVVCLNVGVDPPDVVKTQPCARLQCWIDPASMSPSKALESIGHALQAQYERWQPRARYKQSLDPTSDEVKKLCCSLRRNAKEERVLFHYNGHGVPRPTPQGEIWVFNRAYTQYIPLSMYDLQTWMGAPSLYVYDCSNAGVIVENFKQFAEQHEREAAAAGGAGEAVSYRNCIQLAACAAGQALPMNPELPADLFTACLTTPVKMAMKWFVLRNRTRVAPDDIDDLIDKIPGQVSDRRTMLGELNWIFTAITDTIAWSSLPPDVFQQLFRADLLTASLCRNFLLAQRLMRSYNCTPVSAPALPSLARHPLWAAWEHTLDAALAQLPRLARCPAAEYRHSPFFRDQLTAFQLWLDVGLARRAPPEQLPLVLQVLLSTLHRVRALRILCRFLSLGGWAVRAVLHVGIFPYMLKLLQAPAPDLRAAMVYIWAKIIAQDPSCQVDLVNAKGHKYFLAVLEDPSVDSEHRMLAAYVLAGIVDNYPPGQEAVLQGTMISACLEQIGEGGAGLRQWACIALGRVWRHNEAARAAAARDLAHEKLFPLLAAPQPEVRAACAFALGTFVAAGGAARGEHATALDHQVAVTLAKRVAVDASPLVRAEILNALQWAVLASEQHFMAVCLQERTRRSWRGAAGGAGAGVESGQDALAPAAPRRPRPAVLAHALALPQIGFGSVYMKLWTTLSAMAREPHPQVSQMASDIMAYISEQVDSVGREAEGGRGAGSSSLPPSPNTRPSPPPQTHTLPAARRPRPAPEDRDSASSSSSGAARRPIVGTQFVEWAWARVARPEGATAPDPESREHHERVWRYTRNRSMRDQARALRAARIARLDAQAFHSRCPLPAAVVLFHPYEQHAAVASKDNFGVWDWGTGAKLCVGAWRRAWGRISALAYLNAHEQALLAVGSAAGHVAVFRPQGSGAEPALLTAWRALEVRPAADYRPPPAQPIYSLAQLVSDQFASGGEERGARQAASDPTLCGAVAGAAGPPWSPSGVLLRWSSTRVSLAVAGRAPTIRLWDLAAEALETEVCVEGEGGVTALWRCGGRVLGAGLGDGGRVLGAGLGDGGHVLGAGLGDGSAALWDTRAPQRPLATLRRHAAPVICLATRPDLYTTVSICAEGVIAVGDTRTGAVRATVRAPGPLAAADVHPYANLIACGSLNQCIGIFDLTGAALNTIKFHEGFMGARIGPVSCLAFHPLRAAMGVGTKDATVSVYAADPRR